MGKSWADVIKKVSLEMVKVGETEMERKEAIVRKLYQEAARGEAWAINALMDRTDGKPVQQVNQNVTNVSVEISQDDADSVT